MAKFKIVGNAFVIESTLKIEDIEFAQRYCPNALKVFEAGEDDKAVKVFEVSYVKNMSDPYIAESAIIFNGISHEGEKYASATVGLPTIEDTDELKGYVADTYSKAIKYLQKVEGSFGAAITAAKNERAALMGTITVG